MPQFRLTGLVQRPSDAASGASSGGTVERRGSPPPVAPADDARPLSGPATAAVAPAEAPDSATAAAPPARPAGQPAGQSEPALRTSLRLLRGSSRPFLHMPSLSVPSRAAVESAARELLSAPVEAARLRMQNPRELSDRIAMGRAIWRDLVIGFAAQLGELNLGFTQLAAMYALADSGTMTVADLADTLSRSPSAVSRMVDTLVARQLIERQQDSEDRRQRTLTLTGRGQALLGKVDRARAEEFLSIVRPLPTAERAVVAMGVAALSTHAMTRRGRLIKQRARR